MPESLPSAVVRRGWPDESFACEAVVIVGVNDSVGFDRYFSIGMLSDIASREKKTLALEVLTS